MIAGPKKNFRAAWERRPEGPAYLPSTVMLLYLAGQCAYFSKHFPPSDIGSLALGGFFRVPAGGSFLEFLNFKIQDLSPLANRHGQAAGTKH